jgi:hypothetical protein
VVNSPIPLFLAIKSVDKQALDLLSSNLNVGLTRVLSLGVSDERRSNNTFVKPVGKKAVFWPHEHAVWADDTRVLQGEIHIPKDTKPSFAFRKIALSVSSPVVLHLVEHVFIRGNSCVRVPAVQARLHAADDLWLHAVETDRKPASSRDGRGDYSSAQGRCDAFFSTA